MVHEFAHPIDTLQLHLVGLDALNDLFRWTGQADIGIAVRNILQLHLPPDRVYLRQFPLDLELLGGSFDNVFDLLLVSVKTEKEQIVQNEPTTGGGGIDHPDITNPC